MKLLGLGDNVCDIYLHTGRMYPGGQALNVAVYAARLGAQADFMGVFGTDEIAEHVCRTLDDECVGRSHCRQYHGENGYAKVALRDGDRVFLGSNKGGVIQQYPIFLTEEDTAYAAQFDVIHTSNNGFTQGLLPRLKRLPAMVSYDFSGSWKDREKWTSICPYLDFAFLSCSELSEEETIWLCQDMHQAGCTVVTATRGSQGALAYDGARFYTQEPVFVQAVDTMGAGDSFAAAMLVEILRALETGNERWNSAMGRADILSRAMSKAAEFAARTCMTNGALGHGIELPVAVVEKLEWSREKRESESIVKDSGKSQR